jgi:predicted nucleic acid-binding protein
MSRYVLDTTVVIDFSKGREPVYSQLTALLQSHDEVGVCAVTLAEFYAGLPISTHPHWDAFFDPLEYWHISAGAAAWAGIYRYTLAHQGIQIATMDALLTAVASEVNGILVTSNRKAFPMSDVTLLELR